MGIEYIRGLDIYEKVVRININFGASFLTKNLNSTNIRVSFYPFKENSLQIHYKLFSCRVVCMISHDTICHAAANFPLISNRFQLDKFVLPRSNLERNLIIALLVAFDCQASKLKAKRFLQCQLFFLILIVIGNACLVLVLVLINL